MIKEQPTIYTCDNCLKVENSFRMPNGWFKFQLKYTNHFSEIKDWGHVLLVCSDCNDANKRPEENSFDRDNMVTRNIFQKIFRIGKGHE